MIKDNTKLSDWLERLKLRNAYYDGVFAYNRAKVNKTLVFTPIENSWEENIFWRMGVFDGSKLAKRKDPVKMA
jgi:hypothetical protein